MRASSWRFLLHPACLLPGLLLCLVAGCVGMGRMPGEDDTSTLLFEPGAPDFYMDAVALMQDGAPVLDVHAGVPYASLAFEKEGEGFVARYELLVRVYGRRGRMPAYEQAWSDTVRVSGFAETQQFDVLTRTERIALDPGRYRVEMVLAHPVSGAQAVRRMEVEMRSLRGSEPTMSDVWLMVRQRGKPFQPVVSRHVRAGFDTLRAVMEVYGLAEAASVAMELLRFRSDTAAAVPPYWHTPAPFTLAYVGVDYSRADTLQRSRRPLQGAGEGVAVEFSLPSLEAGNYCVDVEAVAAGGGAVLRSDRHCFSVKGRDFPHVRSLDEMVDALAYIATEREMEELRAAETPEELRRRFDAFWAARVPNRQAAAQLLERYYARVEEANVLFSNYKAGWKTDLGMVYIVLGPPAHTERAYQRHEWYYYRGMHRLPVFEFRRAGPYGLSTLFDNYVLQRRAGMEELWVRAVERWRDGRAQ